MLHWIRSAQMQLRELSAMRLQLYAANASFFLLISAFPAVMLLVTLVRFLPLEAADLLEASRLFLPKATQELAAYLIEDLYGTSTGTVISFSLIVALWSASRGVLALLGGVNAAYGVQETRSWLRRRLICMVYTLVLVLMLALTLALLAFGNRLQMLLVRAIPAMASVMAWIMPLRLGVMLLGLVGLFMAIYFVFPDQRMRYLRQLPGALLAAVGWIGFSTGYSLYLEHFSGASYLYGSLTAMVVTMLWLYSCMCIVFFGAVLNAGLERHGVWRRRETNRQ